MNYNKPFNFLKNLPIKLNNFYKKHSRFKFRVDNGLGDFMEEILEGELSLSYLSNCGA